MSTGMCSTTACVQQEARHHPSIRTCVFISASLEWMEADVCDSVARGKLRVDAKIVGNYAFGNNWVE